MKELEKKNFEFVFDKKDVDKTISMLGNIKFDIEFDKSDIDNILLMCDDVDKNTIKEVVL